MELTFSLRLDRLENGKAAVHGRVCWRSQKVRFSTDQWVEPRLWDGNQVKGKGPEIRTINRRISDIKYAIEDLFDTKTSSPTVEEVRAEIARIKSGILGTLVKSSAIEQPKQPAQPELFEFCEIYRKERKADVSKSLLRTARVATKHLKDFRPNLTWSDLTLSFLNQFKVYLLFEEELSDNTVHAYIYVLKGILKYADQLEYTVPRGYQFLSASVGDTIRPTLLHDDLAALAKLDLSLHAPTGDHRNLGVENWSQFRDLVLMACYTGLRHSDLSKIKLSNCHDIDGFQCLQITQQKTGSKVIIPLIEQARALITKYPDGFDVPARALHNIRIKQLAQWAGLKRQVTLSTSKQGQMQERTAELWKVCSSHICRHTFATLMLRGGMNVAYLQAIMGHDSIASTMKYPTLSSSQIIHSAIDAWRQSA